MTYESFGWKGKASAFLIGQKIALDDGCSFVNQPVSPDLLMRANLLGVGRGRGGVAQAPDHSHWSRVVNLMTQGTAAQALYVISSLAAPMIAMECLDRPVLVTLSGPKGSGKWTAEAAAQAAWGRPGGVMLYHLSELNALRGKMIGFPLIIENIFGRDRGSVLDAISRMTVPTQTVLGYGVTPTFTAFCATHIELKADKIHDRAWPRTQTQKMLNKASGSVAEILIKHLLSPGAIKTFDRISSSWRDDVGTDDRGVALSLIAATATTLRDLGILEISHETILSAVQALRTPAVSCAPDPSSPSLSSPEARERDPAGAF